MSARSVVAHGCALVSHTMVRWHSPVKSVIGVDNHATKGAIAEAKVAAKLTEMGYICSLPVVHAARYDLILDFDNVMVRVQVKHAYEGANGKLRVDLRGKNSYNGKEPYTAHEVDAFAVYYDETVYWFWFNETPDTGIKRPQEWFEQYRVENKIAESAQIKHDK